MAAGVASHFLQLLEADRRAAGRRVLVGAALAVGLLGPAYVLLPWAGVAVHAGAIGAGIVLGAVLAGRAMKRYEGSLKDGWQRWMRFAVASESIPEIARKVHGRSGRNTAFLHAAGLAALWVLELALLYMALRDHESAALAIPALALNGLVAGAVVGHFVRMRKWTGDLRDSVGELVQSGELGLWGVV